MPDCLSITHQGYVSILGGMFINLVLGSFYLWGTLNLYIASYFRALDPSFTLENSIIVFPLMSFSFHSAAPLSVKLCEKFGFRFYMFLCILSISCSNFFAVSIDSFYGFLIIYGFLFGFSSGLTYLIPLYNAFKYFPLRRGLVTGLILGAYGFGSTLSGALLMFYLNPNNDSPLKDSIDNSYYFSKEICNNLRYSLRILSGFYLLLGCIGILLCIEYEEDEEIMGSLEDVNKENAKDLVVELMEDEDKSSENENYDAKNEVKNSKISKISKNSIFQSVKISQLAHKSKKISIFGSKIGKWSIKTFNPEDETRCKSLSDALKSKLFILLILMLTLSSSNGFFLAANYKNLGILSIPDDNFLTIVGSVGAISNGAGRVLWGVLMDKYKFHRTFIILLVLEMIAGISIRIILNFKWIYLICVGIAFFCLGGHPVLFPTFCIKCFGAKIGAQLYGILFWGMFFGNFLQTIVVLLLKKSVGFENMGFLFIAGSIVCLAIVKWVRLQF